MVRMGPGTPDNGSNLPWDTTFFIIPLSHMPGSYFSGVAWLLPTIESESVSSI
jgi:hypothetical protein